MPLLPKEHGAYGQLAFPMVTAFLVAGVSASGLLVAAAAVAAFLAHEPVLILLGLRGARARREQRREAAVWLACCGAAGLIAGITAVVTMPVPARWSLAVPLAPALLLATATARGREKSWYGEVAAATAFSFLAVPVVLAAGAPLPRALTVAVPFAALSIASTLAVRVVILRVRGGGAHAPAAAATRRATFGFAAGMGAAIAGGSAIQAWPPLTLLAAAPGLIVSSALAAFPPPPARLRSVGWTLVALSLATAAIVVAGGHR